jgi:peroxidase
MDLVSLNVQRGRDHGVPPYNIWRSQCGLTRFERWSDMIVVASPETIDHLSSVYENVNDVDLVIFIVADCSFKFLGICKTYIKR